MTDATGESVAWRVPGNRSERNVYHTDPDCRSLPDDAMVIDPDHHPGLVECEYCRGEYDNSGSRDFDHYLAAKEAGEL